MKTFAWGLGAIASAFGVPVCDRERFGKIRAGWLVAYEHRSARVLRGRADHTLRVGLCCSFLVFHVLGR